MPHAPTGEAADEHERANGRLYREVQFALPKELSETERRELAGRFAERLTGGERLPYALAIHRGDGGNPHSHLMFSERTNDGIERSAAQWFRRYNAKAPEKGGALKSRTAVPQAWLEQTREAWAQEANRALEQAGRGERIDHRSLADLRDEAHRDGDLERAAELSREPNVHLGPQTLQDVSGGEEGRLVSAAEGGARGAAQSRLGAGAGRDRRADRADGGEYQLDRAGVAPGRAGDSRNGGTHRGAGATVLGAGARPGLGMEPLGWPVFTRR